MHIYVDVDAIDAENTHWKIAFPFFHLIQIFDVPNYWAFVNFESFSKLSFTFFYTQLNEKRIHDDEVFTFWICLICKRYQAAEHNFYASNLNTRRIK